MPTGRESIEIQAAPEAVFDLIHDYDRRLEWDPFLREARLLHGADRAGAGITSRCVARWAAGGLAMETVYVSFHPPSVAAVKMMRGPMFLRCFAAALRQETVAAGRTRVSYHYSFEARPRWLRFLIEPVVQRIFARETRRRLVALKRYLERSRINLSLGDRNRVTE